jgi:predicted DNA-binding protein
MSKAATAIRFEPEERELIQAYAKLHGKNFSTVVREAVLERIEDEYDIKLYNEAILDDDGIRYTLDEVKKMHGIV